MRNNLELCTLLVYNISLKLLYDFLDLFILLTFRPFVLSGATPDERAFLFIVAETPRSRGGILQHVAPSRYDVEIINKVQADISKHDNLDHSSHSRQYVYSKLNHKTHISI